MSSSKASVDESVCWVFIPLVYHLPPVELSRIIKSWGEPRGGEVIHASRGMSRMKQFTPLQVMTTCVSVSPGLLNVAVLLGMWVGSPPTARLLGDWSIHPWKIEGATKAPQPHHAQDASAIATVHRVPDTIAETR